MALNRISFILWSIVYQIIYDFIIFSLYNQSHKRMNLHSFIRFRRRFIYFYILFIVTNRTSFGQINVYLGKIIKNILYVYRFDLNILWPALSFR